MIGPSVESNGGVSAIIKQLIDSSKLKDCISTIETHKEGTRLYKFFIAVKAFLNFLLNAPFVDIVHIHLSLRASLYRKFPFFLFSKVLKKKTVIHMHEGEFDSLYSQLSSYSKKLVDYVINNVDCLVVLSDEWKEYFLLKFPGCKRVVVIHNSVVVEEMEIPHPLTHDILFLGTLNENKNPGALIEAVPSLIPEFPDIKIYFAGNGNIDFYKKLASGLGISEYCDFLGWIDSSTRNTLFNKCSVICLPSNNEGLPMSLLEGMSFGLCPVSSAVGGIPSLIKTGSNGILCFQNDSKNISEAIFQLFRNKDFYNSLSLSANKTIFDKFNIDQISEQLLSEYLFLFNDK